MSKTFILIIAVLIIIGGLFWWQRNNIENIISGFSKPAPTCVSLCGDGTCQEIVCLAIGCPCAETKESCPQDCNNKKCERNYILNDEHKLIPDRESHPNDLNLIRRFNVQKQCLDGSKPAEIWIEEPPPLLATDQPYEVVTYCKNESKFLVIKSLGLKGANFYFYEGKPCK